MGNVTYHVKGDMIICNKDLNKLYKEKFTKLALKLLPCSNACEKK